MAELPEDIYDRICAITDEGNACADEGEYEDALRLFEQAITLLPPEVDGPWSARMWLLASIGDMQFQLGRYPDAIATLEAAVRDFDDALANPFFSLRLGQSALENGEEALAAQWLTKAFMLGDHEVFQDDDHKYFAFIKRILREPPGGWPPEW